MLLHFVLLIAAAAVLFLYCRFLEKNGHNLMFARLKTDYEIKDLWVFAILEAMTTD